MIPNKILIRCGTLLIIAVWSLLIGGFTEAESADWKLFQVTAKGSIYYFDSESVKRFPDDIIQVWIKIIEIPGFSDKELKELKDTKKPESVIEKVREKATGEWKQLFEINCLDKMVRVRSATLYDKKGDVKENYKDPSEWVPIPANSVTDHLMKSICS